MENTMALLDKLIDKIFARLKKNKADKIAIINSFNNRINVPTTKNPTPIFTKVTHERVMLSLK